MSQQFTIEAYDQVVRKLHSCLVSLQEHRTRSEEERQALGQTHRGELTRIKRDLATSHADADRQEKVTIAAIDRGEEKTLADLRAAVVQLGEHLEITERFLALVASAQALTVSQTKSITRDIRAARCALDTTLPGPEPMAKTTAQLAKVDDALDDTLVLLINEFTNMTQRLFRAAFKAETSSTWWRGLVNVRLWRWIVLAVAGGIFWSWCLNNYQSARVVTELMVLAGYDYLSLQEIRKIGLFVAPPLVVVLLDLLPRQVLARIWSRSRATQAVELRDRVKALRATASKALEHPIRTNALSPKACAVAKQAMLFPSPIQ